jgi:hypothetical protein
MVRAFVSDAETGTPLIGARVTLRNQGGTGDDASGTTNGDGLVRLVAEPGSYTLEASHVDYLSVAPRQLTLRDAEELLVELKLSQTVDVLEPLIVTGTRRDPRHDATRAGMLARRALYADSWNQMVLIHGDSLMQGTRISEVVQRLPASIGTQCRIYFWEGNLVPSLLEASILADRHPQHFGAVEFYRTWEDAPQAYRQAPSYITGSPMFCSIVALWSRTDVQPDRRNRWWAVLASAVVAATVILLSR